MTGSEVTEIRNALGLTAEQLAARLGVHRITVSRWEKAAEIPRVAEMALMALRAGVVDAAPEPSEAAA